MAEGAGEAGKAEPGAAPDAERAAYEGRPRSYWGLRPRRGVRRVLLVVVATALAVALAWELVALWRFPA